VRTVNLQETVAELEIRCSKNSERKKQITDEIFWEKGEKLRAISLHVSSIEQNTAQILKEADDSRITQVVQ